MEQEDFDVSEEFQNYVLSKEEHPYHEVVIPREICETKEYAETLMRWTVPLFFCTCSLYFTLRMLARALKLFIGDHTDTNNPFHWHHVQFNLPCTTGYYPSLSYVRIISFYGELVVRVIVFFDYECVYRLGVEFVRSILKHICAGLKFLGNQEAVRKRTAGGQWPHAWCGFFVYTDHNLPAKIPNTDKVGLPTNDLGMVC